MQSVLVRVLMAALAVGGFVASRAMAAEDYAVGQTVQVQWGTSWWVASVLQVEEGRYKIHYAGHGDSFDEWVGPDRIRALPAAAAPTTAPATGALAVGAAIEVESNGVWYAATVREIDGERTLINYDGYSDTFNEWVTPARIKLNGQVLGAAKEPGTISFAGVWVFDALSGRSTLQINDDGTYLHTGSNHKYAGTWKPVDGQPGAYLLPDAAGGTEEWTITFVNDGDAIRIARKDWPTSPYSATRAADDTLLRQPKDTPAEFFHGRWRLVSHGSLKTAHGTLALDPSGTASFTDAYGGPTIAGTWRESDAFDGVIVTAGDLKYELRQFYADNRALYVSKDGLAYVGDRVTE